ncbi:MAG: DinB family protein [Cryomorphaceae bacterium]|nr:DinB family protein [Flavobacteriales bacterium]
MNETQTRLEISPGEYATYYANYVKYISPGSLAHVLHSDQEQLNSLFSVLDEKSALHRYALEKWTIKEVLVHCIDTERLFSARALQFARGEESELKGYDHESYVANSNANSRSLNSISSEWRTLRKATYSLFENFDEETLRKKGKANGNIVSVRAIAFIVTGHVMHHLSIIRERYGIDF